MNETELKANLDKLGIEFKLIPSDSDNVWLSAELTLPENMDWELAKKLLPEDLVLGMKNPPKPTIQYYNADANYDHFRKNG